MATRAGERLESIRLPTIAAMATVIVPRVTNGRATSHAAMMIGATTRVHEVQRVTAASEPPTDVRVSEVNFLTHWYISTVRFRASP